MTESSAQTQVEWLPWGQRAFHAADHLDQPLLLALSAPWCHWCHEMDETTYAEPRIAANINDGFVPVRVNVDRHPGVRDRYATGGFPSTVFCTPTGEIIAGAGYLDPDGFRSILQTVRERWRAAGPDAGRTPRAIRDQSPPSGPLDKQVEQHLTGQLAAQWDDTHGGWGEAEKFPLPETVLFALKRDRQRAIRVLDLIRDSLQASDGSIYRHAQRDWTDPVEETLTDTTAGVLSAFAHAYCLTGNDRFREAASDAATALTGPLWVDEHVAASRGDSTDDRAPQPDGVDTTFLADRNATAATGLLWLAAYTESSGYIDPAKSILERLQSLTESGKVPHTALTTGPVGHLADQARVLEAFVTAIQVLGTDYLETACTVADATLDTLGTNRGPLLDAVPDGPALLARPLRPLDHNAVAADSLVTLAELTDESAYREAARSIVTGFAGAADRIGVQAARYGTATARAVSRPLTISVATEPNTSLHRAALRVADHEAVVRPAADGEPGTAWVRRGEHVGDPVRTPAALTESVQSLLEATD